MRHGLGKTLMFLLLCPSRLARLPRRHAMGGARVAPPECCTKLARDADLLEDGRGAIDAAAAEIAAGVRPARFGRDARASFALEDGVDVAALGLPTVNQLPPCGDELGSAPGDLVLDAFSRARGRRLALKHARPRPGDGERFGLPRHLVARVVRTRGATAPCARRALPLPSERASRSTPPKLGGATDDPQPDRPAVLDWRTTKTLEDESL